jgi:hypothetical protein
MRRSLVWMLCAIGIAACTDIDDEGVGPDELEAPSDLTYQLMPSGDPDAPNGILLSWIDPGDADIEVFVIYSRASSGDTWSRRAATTSSTFHDAGIPHLQYYVVSEDAAGNQSTPSNSITVDERNRLPAPSTLVSVSLDRAVQLSWPANGRTANASMFDYYRVYSTPYDLDANLCDGDFWALEGTTVSEDFLATGLANGAPRCFATSTVSRDGHESVWTTPRADTPRYDSRNMLLFAVQDSLAASGFRFHFPSTGAMGAVVAGNRTDIDFKLERRADGSVWITPVRDGSKLALYSTSPVTDLTSIDIAPARSQFTTGAIEAVPGYAYVVETLLSDGLHYGAVRVSHATSDYMIFDWAYQTDPGNPELRVGVRVFAGL